MAPADTVIVRYRNPTAHLSDIFYSILIFHPLDCAILFVFHRRAFKNNSGHPIPFAVPLDLFSSREIVVVVVEKRGEKEKRKGEETNRLRRGCK